MRIPRFRVRTLMIAVAVVAVVAAPVTWRLREIERQRRLAESLARIHVGIDVNTTAIFQFLPNTPPAGSRVSVGPPARPPETIREPEPE